MSRPQFSIVIPTRNRARLLRSALDSALAQRDADFEVVVSDEASDDETPEFLAAVSDARVRVARADTHRGQPDGWEAAIALAAGEWVTILSDDDALCPSTLSRVAELVDAGAPRCVAYQKAWYVHPGLEPPWHRAGEVNHLMTRPFAGSVSEIDSRDQLERFFRREEREPIPGMTNAVVHRSLLDALRAEAGRVFRYPDPAAVACVGFLALEPAYLGIDLPLNVEGVSRTSVSSGYRHGVDGTHAGVRAYHAADLFTEVPLRSRTMANAAAESLLRAQAALPERLTGLRLDPVAYYLSIHAELTDPARTASSNGELAEWREALRAEPGGVRRQVWARVARRALRASARRIGPLRAAARAARDRAGSGPELFDFDGTACGFSDIARAAAFLETRFNRRA